MAASGGARSASVPFFPDFFLVGAPRCGTTSMSRTLAAHPAVCFSQPKEPHYFSYRDAASADELRRDYLELFFPHYDPVRHLELGEGSVSYLYSPEAIDRVLGWNPDARFLAMVRDPMKMLPSYHQRLLYVLEEDEPDFRRAWALQERRACGQDLPRDARDPRLLQYANVGRLGHHVRALFARAGRDRVHVVVLDDVAADPAGVYRGVIAFLGLPDDGRRTIDAKNESRGYRWHWLHRLLYRPPAPVLKLAIQQHRKKGKKTRIRRLRKRLRQWNRTETPPAPLDREMRAVLRDAFAEDVAALGELLERDLGHWLQVDAP